MYAIMQACVDAYMYGVCRYVGRNVCMHTCMYVCMHACGVSMYMTCMNAGMSANV